MEWYRRYVGTCQDAKLAEVAAVAGAPRCLAIVVWDFLLESACEDEACGAYSTTARRIAAVLLEPVEKVAAVLAAMAEIGMIADGAIVAWEKRQPVSSTPEAAAERQRRLREKRRRQHREAQIGASAPLSQPVTDCHGPSRPVTASHALEEEEETESDSSSASARGREAVSGGRPEPPNVTPLPGLRPLGRDALEAECRLLLGSLPVVTDPDFGPVRELIGRDGVERGDALAACRAAADNPQFRPRSWRQLEGWVRRAARERIEAALPERPRVRDGPGKPGKPRKTSNLAFLNRRAYGPDFDADERGGFASAATIGPVIEGRVGSG